MIDSELRTKVDKACSQATSYGVVCDSLMDCFQSAINVYSALDRAQIDPEHELFLILGRSLNLESARQLGEGWPFGQFKDIYVFDESGTYFDRSYHLTKDGVYKVSLRGWGDFEQNKKIAEALGFDEDNSLALPMKPEQKLPFLPIGRRGDERFMVNFPLPSNSDEMLT